MNCPHCQNVLPEDQILSCPHCGYALPGHTIPPATYSPDKSQRRIYWLMFWLSFLITPLAALSVTGAIKFIPNIVPFVRMSPVAVVGCGALFSGYALAKLFAKTTIGLVFATIGLALGVLMIYGAIVFVGCIAVLGGAHF